MFTVLIYPDTSRTFLSRFSTAALVIALCREIATASKHVEVTQGADKTIDAITSAAVENVVDNDGKMIVTRDAQPVVVTTWVLMVLDSGQKRPVLEVLEQALEFWTQFIYSRKISQ